MVNFAFRCARTAWTAGMLLLNVFLASPDCRAEQPASALRTSNLRIVGPDQLFAGDAEEPELEIHLDAASPAAETPVVVVSSGSVGPVNRIGIGHWAFRYRLPSEKYPQVILVAAYLRSQHQLTELRIPLYGKPVVAVQSEPGVSLEVRDGPRSFGPVQTDAAGRAEVRIEVPPGRTQVETYAKDSFGNITEGVLPLELPDFPRFLPVCSSEEQAVYVIAQEDSADESKDSVFELTAPHLQALTGVPLRSGVRRYQLRSTRPVEHDTAVTVRIAAGEESHSCNLVVQPPPKQRPPKLSGITTPVEPKVRFFLGPALAWTSNLGKLNGLSGGLRAAYPFSQTRLGLRLEAEFSYLHSAGSGRTQEQDAFSLNLEALPVALGLRYVLGFGVWEPSVSLGAGATGTIAKLRGPNADSTTYAAPLLVGGSLALARKLDTFTLCTELGYWYSRLDVGGIVGNIQGLRTGVTALFEL
jgi:hypothetical protein